MITTIQEGNKIIPVLKFGTGDICITNAQIDDEPGIAYVLFTQGDSGEIGRSNPEMIGVSPWSEIPKDIIMSFDKAESIDTFIDRLQSAKKMLTKPE